MRRYDRLALRVQSLNSGDQPAEDGLVFLFAPAAMPIWIELHRRCQRRRPVAGL